MKNDAPDNPVLLAVFRENASLAPRRHYLAVQLWKEKNCPLCPGLAKGYGKKTRALLSVTSTSYAIGNC